MWVGVFVSSFLLRQKGEKEQEEEGRGVTAKHAFHNTVSPHRKGGFDGEGHNKGGKKGYGEASFPTAHPRALDTREKVCDSIPSPPQTAIQMEANHNVSEQKNTRHTKHHKQGGRGQKEGGYPSPSKGGKGFRYDNS